MCQGDQRHWQSDTLQELTRHASHIHDSWKADVAYATVMILIRKGPASTDTPPISPPELIRLSRILERRRLYDGLQTH